jgi:hypothetical protein
MFGDMTQIQRQTHVWVVVRYVHATMQLNRLLLTMDQARAADDLLQPIHLHLSSNKRPGVSVSGIQSCSMDISLQWQDLLLHAVSSALAGSADS